MTFALLLLAIAPALAIVWFIYHKDRYEKEPLRYLFLAFLIGVASVFPASYGADWMEAQMSGSIGTALEAFIYAFVVIALSEELVKFLFLRLYIYRKAAFNEPIDGIVYGVMIGMGFACFENIFYVMDGGIRTAMIRMFTAVPAHAVFGIVMGYYVGKAKYTPEKRISFTAKAFLVPYLLHGCYDFLLFQDSYPLLGIGAFLGLLVAIRYAFKMIKEQQDASPFKPEKVD
jgi:protease PrsW